MIEDRTPKVIWMDTRQATMHGNCEVCKGPLSLVCDPTGEHEFLHCWTCWDDYRAAMNAREQAKWDAMEKKKWS
jgi:hypothetical protein